MVCEADNLLLTHNGNSVIFSWQNVVAFWPKRVSKSLIKNDNSSGNVVVRISTKPLYQAMIIKFTDAYMYFFTVKVNTLKEPLLENRTPVTMTLLIISWYFRTICYPAVISFQILKLRDKILAGYPRYHINKSPPLRPCDNDLIRWCRG